MQAIDYTNNLTDEKAGSTISAAPDEHFFTKCKQFPLLRPEQEVSYGKRICKLQEKIARQLLRVPGLLAKMILETARTEGKGRIDLLVGYNAACSPGAGGDRIEAAITLIKGGEELHAALASGRNSEVQAIVGRLGTILGEFRLHMQVTQNLGKHASRLVQYFKGIEARVSGELKKAGLGNAEAERIKSDILYESMPVSRLSVCLDQDTLRAIDAAIADVGRQSGDAGCPAGTLRDACTKIHRFSSELEQSLHELVAHNYRLVMKFAYKHLGRGLDLDDLFQEGVIGLMKAAGRYDPFSGNRFSTYAVNWIVQAMQRSIIDKGTTVRLPVHLTEAMHKMDIEKGRREAAGDVVDELALAREMKLTRMVEENLAHIPRRYVSFEAPIGESDTTVGDLIEDPNDSDASQNAELSGAIEKALKSLDSMERNVIVLRFGLSREKPLPRSEIADLYRTNREKIRRIEIGAISKLARGGNQELFEFWDFAHIN